MASESDKLYEEIERLNKRISELESESSRSDNGGVNAAYTGNDKDLGVIPEQESFVVDSHSLGGYRNLSLPNGGVMKVKVLPFCKNGNHIIKSIDEIVVCSRCGGMICKEHAFDISPPMCRECIEKELSALTYKELMVLFAVENKLGMRYLTNDLKLNWREVEEAAANCVSLGYLRQSVFNFLFSGFQTTFEGKQMLYMASLIYDFPSLEQG